ncbi:DUF928 domain-containing protein [Pseudanabaena sp. Chao 1811]|uniref:DUF928 domain-containing protein n=1 Tax=Pseudanabaena sp. Chao 1811 TaxID=2963092 RepID=UPI0022F3D57B|nr:DUF928 domain-containing protein [Pseudanabaena sp. Chao 1811]
MLIGISLKQALDLCPKSISLLIFLSGISWCLPVAVQSSPVSSYGLGIKPQLSSQVVLRCGASYLIAVDLLAPDDGGKTLASRPTFYWYIERKPLFEKYPKKFIINFILRDGFERSAKSIFSVTSKPIQVNQKGILYKLTLPSNAPLIDIDKIYAWQIRYMDVNDQGDSVSRINAITFIKRESNQSVMDLINKASTDLHKARIYASNAYWYDALDAYSKWIDTNPRDQQALNERMQMLDQIIDRQQKLKCASKFNAIDSRLNMMQATPLK